RIAVRFLVVVAEAPGGCRSGSAGKLPFGFRRQAICFSLLLTQPTAKLLSILPRHIYNWHVVRELGTELALPIDTRMILPVSQVHAALAISFGLSLIICRFDKATKLPNRRLAITKAEWPRKLDAVLRKLRGSKHLQEF